MKDKAAVIKMAVGGGITDLDIIRGVFNSYAEGGYKVQKGGFSMENSP